MLGWNLKDFEVDAVRSDRIDDDKRSDCDSMKNKKI